MSMLTILYAINAILNFSVMIIDYFYMKNIFLSASYCFISVCWGIIAILSYKDEKIRKWEGKE